MKTARRVIGVLALIGIGVCFHCGAQMKADAKFCTNCGKAIEGEEK